LRVERVHHLVDAAHRGRIDHLVDAVVTRRLLPGDPCWLAREAVAIGEVAGSIGEELASPGD
jgi:hypothetical protein